MRLSEEKSHGFELPFHVVKKLDTSKKRFWTVRIVGILIALLLAGVLCTILKPGTFATFYEQMFLGCFDPTDFSVFLELLETIGLLLLVALALTPAFKMKFWNIGGEGQILIGCWAAAACCKFMPTGTSDAVIIICALISAIGMGIVWALLPAIFKAFFNTNETLFTLMMNYVAMGIISLSIFLWVPDGSMVIGTLKRGNLPEIAGLPYIINLIIIAVVAVLMFIYLKKTKHGYEITVVGESVNTAKYIGINVKKVIIRTMILSGALCGLAGFLLVCGHHHTLSTGLAGGRGFTAVLIAWLGMFQPGQIVLYSSLVGIFQCGSTQAASSIGMSKDYFSSIVTGMFFLVVIASEFFVNYEIKLKNGKTLSFDLLKNKFKTEPAVVNLDSNSTESNVSTSEQTDENIPLDHNENKKEKEEDKKITKKSKNNKVSETKTINKKPNTTIKKVTKTKVKNKKEDK